MGRAWLAPSGCRAQPKIRGSLWKPLPCWGQHGILPGAVCPRGDGGRCLMCGWWFGGKPPGGAVSPAFPRIPPSPTLPGVPVASPGPSPALAALNTLRLHGGWGINWNLNFWCSFFSLKCGIWGARWASAGPDNVMWIKEKDVQGSELQLWDQHCWAPPIPPTQKSLQGPFCRHPLSLLIDFHGWQLNYLGKDVYILDNHQDIEVLTRVNNPLERLGNCSQSVVALTLDTFSCILAMIVSVWSIDCCIWDPDGNIPTVSSLPVPSLSPLISCPAPQSCWLASGNAIPRNTAIYTLLERLGYWNSIASAWDLTGFLMNPGVMRAYWMTRHIREEPLAAFQTTASEFRLRTLADFCLHN